MSVTHPYRVGDQIEAPVPRAKRVPTGMPKEPMEVPMECARALVGRFGEPVPQVAQTTARTAPIINLPVLTVQSLILRAASHHDRMSSSQHAARQSTGPEGRRKGPRCRLCIHGSRSTVPAACQSEALLRPNPRLISLGPTARSRWGRGRLGRAKEDRNQQPKMPTSMGTMTRALGVFDYACYEQGRPNTTSQRTNQSQRKLSNRTGRNQSYRKGRHHRDAECDIHVSRGTRQSCISLCDDTRRGRQHSIANQRGQR